MRVTYSIILILVCYRFKTIFSLHDYFVTNNNKPYFFCYLLQYILVSEYLNTTVWSYGSRINVHDFKYF